MSNEKPNLVLNVKMPIGDFANLAATGLGPYLAENPLKAHCPQCGSELTVDSASTECPGCGLPVHAEIE